MFMRVLKLSAFAALLVAGLAFGSAPASAQCGGCYVPVYQPCGCGSVGYYGGYYQATYGYAANYGVGYGGGYGYGGYGAATATAAMPMAAMRPRSRPTTTGPASPIRAIGVRAGPSPVTDKLRQ